jgi:propanediol dehydratase small subunit
MYVDRQQLGKTVTAATNKRATIEELLDMSSSMRSVLYQSKVCDQFFPEILD